MDHILYSEIFGNCFPNLKSCYLPKDGRITKNIQFKNLLLLYNLQIGMIDLEIYKNILSVCLNLNYFKFTLKSNEISFDIQPHINLKRMIIKPEDYNPINNAYAIDICLSFVPNLERLYIQQDFYQIAIPYYLTCDWHTSSIDKHTRLLRQFKYELKYWYLTGIGLQIVNTIDEMKKNFQHIHNHRYQSQFRTKLVS